MSMAAGILFSDGKHILLLKRIHTDKTSPRTWCIPGGGSDKGESSIETAIRELREETGVQKLK